MFARIKQVGAIGAAVAGIGFAWVSVVDVTVAQAQPPRITPGDEITCPAGAGIRYLPDPENPNAYYVCENGSEQQHEECPGTTKLDMAVTPPECFANQDMYHP